MTHAPLKLDAAAVEALLQRAFPDSRPEHIGHVVLAEPGRVRIVRAAASAQLRPGGVISGPTLMGLADTAAYALVLAHRGEELMAVTSSLVMNFLRGAEPGDITAECVMLRLGRRIAVCDVRIWTTSPDRLAAQATVTYALPSS